MRFTIRDLLWLTVVVALAVGWIVDHYSMRQWTREVLRRHAIDQGYIDLRGPQWPHPLAPAPKLPSD